MKCGEPLSTHLLLTHVDLERELNHERPEALVWHWDQGTKFRHNLINY